VSWERGAQGLLASEPRSVVLSFALALAIGALIGVERERKKRAGEPSFAGLRTFVLIAEVGALSAWLARELDAALVFVGAGALVTAVLLVGHWNEVRARPEALGLTTEVAGLVTFLLGGLVVLGHAELAVALAIATAAVLAFKEPLHGLVERIGRADLEAVLKLLIATFIVLPVLPDRPVDPWQVLNPYAMWWLVILISSLSLAGYAATRLFGQGHGLVLTGLAGGLVSSTAVTLAFARQSRERVHGPVDAMASGLFLAWSVMFARIGVAVALVHRPLLAPLLAPLGVMGVAALGAALFRYRRAARAGAGGRAPDVPLRNPFRLTASIRFALYFALTLLGVELVRRTLPPGGLYLAAALAGLTDVDAITLSLAELAHGGGPSALAAGAITLAALTNTLVKCGLVVALGSDALRRAVLAPTVVLVAGGLLALVLA
jgi:uncharacterized membrane protein (DUF4010 family)